MHSFNNYRFVTADFIFFQFIPSTFEQAADDSVRSVTVECPARIDIAGGWSDTPPITYEHGGAVVNAAILVDGARPMGVRVEKIAEKQLRLVTGVDRSNVVVINELKQMADYTSPQAPASLLKAAFVCAGIVQLPCSVSELITAVEHLGVPQ